VRVQHSPRWITCNGAAIMNPLVRSNCQTVLATWSLATPNDEHGNAITRPSGLSPHKVRRENVGAGTLRWGKFPSAHRGCIVFLDVTPCLYETNSDDHYRHHCLSALLCFPSEPPRTRVSCERCTVLGRVGRWNPLPHIETICFLPVEAKLETEMDLASPQASGGSTVVRNPGRATDCLTEIESGRRNARKRYQCSG
jgi:hypothetical protein